MAGAARIAPPLLLGKLFRLLGADAVVYPNHGGRFGYSPETCREIAATALAKRNGRKPALPVPAGGMTTDRVREMLDFYGADIMLLIGGGLLSARDRLVEETAAFVTAVKNHRMATMTSDEPRIHRKAAHCEAAYREAAQYRWEGVDVLPYKEDERALFKAITRQVLVFRSGAVERVALFRSCAGWILHAGTPRNTRIRS